MANQKYFAVKGMPDILPPATRTWQEVESAARRIFSCFGFEEIRTPIAENTELFRRGVGEHTSIVEKEMYTFEDQGGDTISLRPEGTASVVRAYIESGAAVSDPIARYFYLGPMFRRERPQKGRQRQFHQIGCEIFGVESALADADVIAMFATFIAEAGAAGVKLEINSLGCPECRPGFNAKLIAFLNARRGKLCDDCVRRIERNPMRVFDCKNEVCGKELAGAPELPGHWCEACRAHYGEVKRALALMKIAYTENPRIVRGLDYYVRTAFEFTTDQLGAQNAVAAGGRYDGLIASLGGPQIAGVGCALGVERLLLLREKSGKQIAPAESVFFAVMGDAARDAMLPMIHTLRADGVRVEWDYAARSLKAQLRRADRLASHSVVIVGDDEIAKGEVAVKNMHTGEQRTVPIRELPRLFVRSTEEA